ncbi:hypothetical protein BDN72DRAFT_873037 [Pluteus cervinus]|uniref:Uncharacterized protein n=1 Tax=Pluteus cervinus TaxID=181527 RepID=A0ACD3A3S1_9AGAR|nr:hypothetical protein BDN72DRAFT_873037 [Pluteus cervinus]
MASRRPALFFYEPDVEFVFYERQWIQEEIERLASDSLQVGVPVQMEWDCYDFRGHSSRKCGMGLEDNHFGDDRTQSHTYWRTDLAPFGPRQETWVLWSNGSLGGNPILGDYVKRYPAAFCVGHRGYFDTGEGDRVGGEPSKAWVDGDLIRLLVLWTYGDLEPLLEHEFVTQWDCYGSRDICALNGALMRFREHSPYPCEAFHIRATSPRSGSTTWGSLLYFKLWRRLIAARVPPFHILPFCFDDGRLCRLDNRLPDPFTPDPRLRREDGGGSGDVLQQVHLHNQWEKPYPRNGRVERLFPVKSPPQHFLIRLTAYSVPRQFVLHYLSPTI